MKCPQCHSDIEKAMKFCRQCGAKLPLICPGCGTRVQATDKFCHECGFELKPKEKPPSEAVKVLSERKHVTALFADLTGYTALCERLDPEEVKDLTSHLLGEIAQVISRYGGFIDKFSGDAVMALFGVPRSHEDDPVRAIMAASEIHRVMGAISREVRERLGQTLAVHIGIDSGLVVTRESALERESHVAGDAVNVASRLCSLAKAEETLVGQTTFSQAEGFFSFAPLEPVKVKGRTKPVSVYKVLAPKELPSKTKHPSGRRAELIGRKLEAAILEEAVARLLEGKGSVISISGEPGTGKSRLIEECKATLDLESVQWLEGHAYAYSQNIPYFPLIDLFNRAFRIEDNDPPDVAKEKAERRIRALVGDRAEVLPYLGDLLLHRDQEGQAIHPDIWKSRLHKAVLNLCAALFKRAPTIISLEDLHWADPSSLELLQALLSDSAQPALFLLVYRPPLDFLPASLINKLGGLHQEVQLKDLSAAEMSRMVGSLLGTDAVPAALQRFIQEKVGGNPFYLEEVINSLIDSGVLTSDNGDWRFTGPIQEAVVPATIQGVITARLDRLDAATKLVLQEASVIGRTFYHEVLASITTLGTTVDQHLQKLQELDLIRVRSPYPDVEYSFKHALIQEAVYNGLLKKQRRNLHERVGLALEKFFQDRSSESWEALAYHFKRGHSVRKALDYLIKSGEKSLKRYALEEAHQYYREAFELLFREKAGSKEEDLLLVDLLMEWSLVFYYQGRFSSLTELLLAHVRLAESLDDKAKTGAFYGWLGFSAFWQGARLEDSYGYLRRALEYGEQTNDRKVIAYACAFLLKTCAEMGYLEEGAAFAQRAREMIGLFPGDAFLHMNYFSGKGYLGWFSGDMRELYESAQGLLDYGKEKESLRCQMGGYMLLGVRRFMDLDLDRAVDYAEKVLAQGDPYHTQFARVLLGMFLVHKRKFKEAEEHLTEVIEYSEKQGTEYLKTFANLFLGVALAAQGNLGEGIRRVQSAKKEFVLFQRNIFYGMSEYILGSIYLQILQPTGKKSLAFLLRNLGPLLRIVPFAGKKAEKHLGKAIQLARQTGAKGFLGQPCLQMGVLFKLRGQKEKAREYLGEAIAVFKECYLGVYLQQAEDQMDSLT